MKNSSLDNIACVAITTHSRGFFYCQQKDESYHIPSFRLMPTFFGGRAEKDENTDDAIVREINEELMPEAANLVVPHIKPLFKIKILRRYLLPRKEYCMIHLYEARLTDNDIYKLEKYDVKEGKRGVILSREELSKVLFPESLHPLIDKYKKFW